MLNIYVIDITAESRNQIINEINSFLQRDIQDHFLIPRVNIKPLAFSEIKFHAAPDICIVGPEIVSQDLIKLSELRKLLPESSIVVKTTGSLENISIFEQFARLGVDDTLPEGITALEFFRKIILLTKRGKKVKSGKLIVVEGAKGGQGTTSLVAALGEILHDQDKKVLLVDFDSESQDLSRFLLVKPFVNENLRHLIDQHRPICEETVMQCLQPVWHEENLFCMPPVAESDDLYDSRSSHTRVFLSVFDILDKAFDYVIVDCAGIRGNLARTLYRIADTVICLINNDPAGLYASSSKVTSIRSNMSVNANLKLLECGTYKQALPSSLVRSEITRSTNLDGNEWLPQVAPYCAYASKWPGSGSTMYSLGGKALKKALSAVVQEVVQGLGYEEKLGVGEKAKVSSGKNFIKGFIKKEKHAALPIKKERELLELPGPEKLLGAAKQTEAISANATQARNLEASSLQPGATQLKTVQLIDLQKNGEAFENGHEPLVSNVRIN